MIKRSRRVVPLVIGALLGVLLVPPPDSGHARSEEWGDLEKAFMETWAIGAVDAPKDLDRFLDAKTKEPSREPEPLQVDALDGLRAKKRSAVKGIAGAKDARAIPLLMAAHAEQVKLIGKLERLHASGEQPWKNQKGAIKKAIRERRAKARKENPDADPKTIEVELTEEEVRWQHLGELVERLQRDVDAEEEIAESVRQSVGIVIDSLEGSERAGALKDLKKDARKAWGNTPVDSTKDLDAFLSARLRRPPAQPKKPLQLNALEALRARKHVVATGLSMARDADAVPILLTGHGKQLKLIEKLQKLHEKYEEPWKKAQEVMEASIGKKQEAAMRANPGVDPRKLTVLVTMGELRWQRQADLIVRIWNAVLGEQEIAEHMRRAVGRAINGLEGDTRARMFNLLEKAAGDGKSPMQIEFIREMGYVAGDEAREALEDYASRHMQPFVVQAALEALGRHNDPKSIDTLLASLKAPRWQVRASALVGLSFFHDVRVVEELLERSKTEDGVMRRHYFSALNKIVGASLPGAAGPWSKWWAQNKEKVVAAWKAGGEVGPVQGDPEPHIVQSEGGGHTSFYGLKTDSKHIIFVLDISGSMGELNGKDENGKLRIDLAKSELKKAINTLSDKDSDERGVASFNVVVYAAEVDVYKEGKMIPASMKNKEKVCEWIDSLEAIGATNIYDALEQAFQIIGTRKARKQLEKGADTIFLMTDGQPNRGKITDPELIRQEIAKMNRDRRITINTIGVGEGHAAEFLEKLAAENHGEYLGRGVKKDGEEKQDEAEKKDAK